MGNNEPPWIPIELLDDAALFRHEPRLRRYYQLVRTRRGLEGLVRRRLAKFKQLMPSQRAARIRHHVASLLKLEIDERVRTLFIKEEVRPYGWALVLLDEDRNAVRDLFHQTRIVPTIILKGVLGETELPVTLGLPVLQMRVRKFVTCERRRARIEVRRGRKTGQHGPEINFSPVVHLAYLADVRHVRRAELLSLANREATPDGYHWLGRRIKIGRQYLTFFPDLKAMLDKASTETLKEALTLLV